MAADHKNDRSPKDLPVPETMKIAALLAELMPPGAQGAKPVTIPASGAGDDGSGASLLPPALEIEDLDDLEPVVPPPMPPVPVEAKATIPGIQPKTATAINPVPTPMRPAPKITATVIAAAPPKPVPPPPPPPPKVEATPPPLPTPRVETPPPPVVRVESPIPPPLPPTPVPPPIPKAATAGEIIGRMNPKATSEPPKAPEAPKPAATPLDPELIPIGGLSAEGYFSLVNWHNEPDRVRHPRRADYGLDEQTIALARKNPFYVLGQPRRPERATVAEVLQEIDW